MRTYNLFISHSWSYSDSYDKLKNLLLERTYFEFKDYSVPKNDPIHTNGSDEELYEAIFRKISPCSVVLILAGVYASYSKWIDKEIEIAKKEFGDQPKPIIAIEPWASQKTSVVKEKADRVVKWNTESVVSAIRDLA